MPTHTLLGWGQERRQELSWRCQVFPFQPSNPWWTSTCACCHCHVYLACTCYKQYPSGNLSSTNGMKFLSRISWYTTESITPINMQMLVLPRYEIPAKTCTLYACLGFGLRAQIFCTFDPGWWKNSRPEDDISTVLSSTKMMFLKSSLLLSASKHQLCLTWISNISAVNSFQIFGHV